MAADAAAISANVSVSGAFAAIFWVVCVSMTFLPKWFADLGLSTSQIATVLACAAWLKVPLTLSAGYLSDRFGRPRRLLLVLSLALVLLMPALLLTEDFLVLCLLWGLLGALLSTCVPLTDNIAIVTARQCGDDRYGRMRLWGSLSFLLCSLAGAWIIGLGVEHTVLLMMQAGVLLLLLFAVLAPDYRTATPMTPVGDRRESLLSELVQLPGFVSTLSIAAAIMASHAALYSLATLHWLSIGLDLPTVGALWAIGVVAEVAVFYFSPRFNALFRPLQFLMIAGAVATLRWLLTAIVTDVGFLFAVQMLHAFTFTFTQLGLIAYIQHRVPAQYSASAQTIYDSCAIGLIFGLALYLCGLVADVSLAWSFYAMAGLAALAALAAGLVDCINARARA